MTPISVASLGSRFWISDNLDQIGGIYQKCSVGANNGVDNVENVQYENLDKLTGKVIKDSTMTSLVSGSDTQRLKPVMDHARMVGKFFNEGKVFENTYERYAADLHINAEEMAKTIARMNRAYLPQEQRPKGELTVAEMKEAQDALNMMLLSDDFVNKAVQLKSSGGSLGKKGEIALANATLGLMKLIRDGKIDKVSVGELLHGEMFDITKPADMLRLAVSTAAKVREEFIDRKGLEEIVKQAKARYDAMDLLSQERYQGELMDLIVNVNELLHLREQAAAMLKCEFDIAGKDKDQINEAIKDVRNRLRAFRYDTDRVYGRSYKDIMEGMRRKLDDKTSASIEGRKALEYYAQLPEVEDKIQQKLNIISNNHTTLENDLEVRDRLKNMLRTSEQTSKSASELSHATNNYVRFYFKGGITSEDKYALDVYNMFEPLFEKGGSKNVIIEVGADCRLGVDLKGITADVKAGGKYQYQAIVNVPPGGGDITVTYLHGGAVEGSGSFHVGHNPSKDEWKGDTSKPKIGVDVNASVEGGVRKGLTVTYKSLNEFIRATSSKKVDHLTKTSAMKTTLFLGRVGQGLRMVGSGIKNLVTMAGLRIHKTRVDHESYRKVLVNHGVFSNVDRMLAPPKQQSSNVVTTSEKTYWQLYGGVKGGAKMSVNLWEGEGEVDPKTGKNKQKSGSIFDLGANAGYQYTTELNVHKDEYRAKIDTLRLLSNEELDKRLGESTISDDLKQIINEVIDPDNSNADYKQRLVQLDRMDVKQQLAIIERAFGKLETAAKAINGTEKADWEGIGKDFRFLTLRYVKLERMVSDLMAKARLCQENDSSINTLNQILGSMRNELGSRLESPNIPISEELFKELFVDKIGESTGEKSTHTVEFGLNYNVGINKLTGMADEATAGLLQNKDGSSNLLQKIGKNTLDSTISNGLSTVGAAGGIKGTVTTEKSNKVDDRPWNNDRATTIAVDFDTNLPMKFLIEQIAEKYIDSMTDKPDPVTKEKLIKETCQELLVGIGMDTGLGIFKSIYSDNTIAELLKVEKEGGKPSGALEFFSSPFMKGIKKGIELNRSLDFKLGLVFRFEHGRLACFSTVSKANGMMNFGLRADIGLLGLGLHYKEQVAEASIQRYSYTRPSVDTLLGIAAKFSSCGKSTELTNFLTHNRTATMRYYDAYVRGLFDEKSDPKIKDDSLLLFKRFAEAMDKVDLCGNKRLMTAKGLPPEIASRAQTLQSKFDELKQEREALNRKEKELSANQLSESGKSEQEIIDKMRIGFMQKLFTTIAAAYQLDHERAYLEKQAPGARQ